MYFLLKVYRKILVLYEITINNQKSDKKTGNREQDFGLKAELIANTIRLRTIHPVP
jgi:hypothetical protein